MNRPHWNEESQKWEQVEGSPNPWSDRGVPSADVEYKNCNAPHCNFKAPVCAYGHCATCCSKHHNYAMIGYTSNHQPPKGGGFRVIESGGRQLALAPPSTTPVVEEVQKPPECGSMEVVLEREFPLENNATGYTRSI